MKSSDLNFDSNFFLFPIKRRHRKLFSAPTFKYRKCLMPTLYGNITLNTILKNLQIPQDEYTELKSFSPLLYEPTENSYLYLNTRIPQYASWASANNRRFNSKRKLQRHEE